MYNKMPLIWFKPIEDYKQDPEEYACPVYKTSVSVVRSSYLGEYMGYSDQCKSLSTSTGGFKKGFVNQIAGYSTSYFNFVKKVTFFKNIKLVLSTIQSQKTYFYHIIQKICRKISFLSS